MHTSYDHLWPACTWFLKIVSVQTFVCMCVYVCGFDILEEVAMMQLGATFQIPAFIKDMDQLPPLKLKTDNYKLANSRIHVERIIGATRQRFPILSSILPIQ